jgi:uncharacterized protein YecT (DUF1311 family)
MMPGRINAAGGGIEFDAGAPTVSMFGVLIVGLAVAAWVGGASAQELDCDNAMAQQDMNRCAGLGYEAADKALNAVWKKAKQAARNLDAEQSDDLQGAEAALVAAQRAGSPIATANANSPASRRAAAQWSRYWSPAAWPNSPAREPGSSRNSPAARRTRAEAMQRGHAGSGVKSVLARGSRHLFAAGFAAA